MEAVKCPQCNVGEMELLNNGGAEDNESWVECTNNECGFADDDSKPEYEYLQLWYGYDADHFEKWIAEREAARETE